MKRQNEDVLNSQRFIHSFWRLRQRIISQINPRIREAHDVDFLEIMLLEQIGTTDLSPSEIAEVMQVPAHTISRKLDSLQKGGLIRRALDPNDARRRVLSLTNTGQEVLKQAQQTLADEVSELLATLSEGDAATMIRSLEAVAQGCTQEVSAPARIQEAV